MAEPASEAATAQKVFMMSNTAFCQLMIMRPVKGDERGALQSFVGTYFTVTQSSSSYVGIVKTVWRDAKGDVWVTLAPLSSPFRGK